jgi:hypothetical protein
MHVILIAHTHSSGKYHLLHDIYPESNLCDFAEVYFTQYHASNKLK